MKVTQIEMSGVRDLFFDEFYEELETVASAIESSEINTVAPPLLADELKRHWNPYTPNYSPGDEVLVSVDGGVQISRFAYGVCQGGRGAMNDSS